MAHSKRHTKFVGTTLQKKLLLLIFASAVIPTAICAASLYYLIFHLCAWQIGVPELVNCDLSPVVKKINLIILISLPVILFLIWIISLELSQKIAGPLYRLERELDERIDGKSHGHIKLRPGDEFRSLVEKINKLICK